MINNYDIRNTKAFLLNLPSKEQFDNLIDEIKLSPIEKKIIIEKFKNYRSAKQISSKLYISIPLVYQKQHKALNKVYNYLKFKNYI